MELFLPPLFPILEVFFMPLLILPPSHIVVSRRAAPPPACGDKVPPLAKIPDESLSFLFAVAYLFRPPLRHALQISSFDVAGVDPSFPPPFLQKESLRSKKVFLIRYLITCSPVHPPAVLDNPLRPSDRS